MARYDTIVGELMTILEGIDVSSYQMGVDMHAVRQAGKHYVDIKASEGNEWQDPTFPANWRNAKQAGLRRYAYHFFYDDIDPLAQVTNLHEYVRANGKFIYGDGVMLDVEETSIYDAGNTVARLEEFIREVWKEIDKPVKLYTNPDTWINLLGNPLNQVISECALELADYGGTAPALKNWPNGMSFLQYSQTGHCPGVDGNVDLSRFFGTKQQLAKIMNRVPKH
jgi:lysozyme